MGIGVVKHKFDIVLITQDHIVKQVERELSELDGKVRGLEKCLFLHFSDAFGKTTGQSKHRMYHLAHHGFEHAAAFTRDAVAADHEEASKAGAEVLAAGGNAADAAAATMLALGVVNPASSGLGGGGFALYYCAKDGSLTFLDFR